MLHGPPARAQLSIRPTEVATDVSISWEVRSRFRLFRDEKDFNRHVAAESGRTILADEQRHLAWIERRAAALRELKHGAKHA